MVYISIFYRKKTIYFSGYGAGTLAQLFIKNRDYMNSLSVYVHFVLTLRFIVPFAGPFYHFKHLVIGRNLGLCHVILLPKKD